MKFAGSPCYKTFLEDNKDSILEVFMTKSSNLRVLTFALTYFQTIFSSFIKDVPQQGILKEKEDEILKKLLKFSLLISIEYREGILTYQERKGLDSINKLNLEHYYIGNPQLGTHENEKKEVEPSFKEKFVQQYYKEDEFQFFQSVYEFITGGSIFNLDVLIQELKAKYHIKKNEVLPQYELYNLLSYPKVWSLSAKDYKKHTKQMLLYSDKGSYELINCLNIFHLASRFENPLKYNLNNLEKRIIKGMRKGKPNFEYLDYLGQYISVEPSAQNKEHLLKIREAAIDLNNEIRIENQVSENSRLEQLCYDDFSLFFTEVLNSNKSYYYDPIFKSFNARKFYSFYLKSKNNVRYDIVRLFSTRYAGHSSSQLKPDIPFLEKLKQKNDYKNDRIPKHGISYFVSTELSKVLQKSIDHLRDVS